MKILTMTLMLIGISAMLQAEYKSKPDTNTLWCEDGKPPLALSAKNDWKGWNNSTIDVSSHPEGGITFRNKSSKGGSGRYVAVSPAYPWLEFELFESESVSNGYRSVSFWLFPMKSQCGQRCTVLNKGIFVINMLENSGIKPTVSNVFFRIDQYGLSVSYKYIRMIKQPENYIKVESPAFAERNYFDVGDKLKFKVILKDSAEDVSLGMFKSDSMYQAQCNGLDKIQLKPEDPDGKIWSAEITVKQIGAKNKPISRQGIMLKATILGGNLKKPLWTALPYGYKNPTQ